MKKYSLSIKNYGEHKARRWEKVKTAILFSGQGAQYAGMGKDLYHYYKESQKIYDRASLLLDWNIKEVCFEDPNGLIHQTRYTQGALFTTNLAVYEAIKAKGIKVDSVLGFSLGEYSALVASGVLDFDDALRLVEKRAIYMDEAAMKVSGGMSAVIGLDREVIDVVCKEVSLKGLTAEVANDNCPGQVIISGTKEGLEMAAAMLKEKGAKRVLPLSVSGPFHSSLMQEAADKIKDDIEKISFKDPVIPIVSNVTARTMTRDEIIENIPLQIIRGVRFRESILYLLSQGYDTFIELGAKKTLCSFVSKISKEVRVMHVEDTKTLQNVLSAL